MIDGLRPEPLLQDRYINLFSLRERSSWTLNALSLMPTITLPCHMIIFHSVPPSRHGVTTNTGVPMEAPIPGLVEIARAAGLRFRSGYEIQSKVTLLETAPTLARILHIKHHPDWEGHCVDEIFE